MTQIDLRIQFKKDTGKHPIWHTTSYHVDCKLKSIYGLWLEELYGQKRMRFKFDTGTSAVYFNKNYKTPISLKYDYIIYLEEQICFHE